MTFPVFDSELKQKDRERRVCCRDTLTHARMQTGRFTVAVLVTHWMCFLLSTLWFAMMTCAAAALVSLHCEQKRHLPPSHLVALRAGFLRRRRRASATSSSAALQLQFGAHRGARHDEVARAEVVEHAVDDTVDSRLGNLQPAARVVST